MYDASFILCDRGNLLIGDIDMVIIIIIIITIIIIIIVIIIIIIIILQVSFWNIHLI